MRSGLVGCCILGNEVISDTRCLQNILPAPAIRISKTRPDTHDFVVRLILFNINPAIIDIASTKSIFNIRDAFDLSELVGRAKLCRNLVKQIVGMAWADKSLWVRKGRLGRVKAVSMPPQPTEAARNDVSLVGTSSCRLRASMA